MSSSDTSARVLLVEDDDTLRELLADHLVREGYAVVSARDGEAGLALARQLLPLVCVLDVMLPKLDGLSLCRIIRRERSDEVGIIMLTARASEIDRIIGLDGGADDYVIKPFSMPELAARVRALLRRSAHAKKTEGVYASGDLSVDVVSRRAFLKDAELKLTTREFDLLAALLRNRGAVLSRDYLLSHVWGNDFDGDARTIDVHVRWLREKIEQDPSKPLRLQTVRGVGYRID
jgi:DNA-binding response OmpR family regulator